MNDSRSRNVLTGGVKGVLYNITNTAHIMSFFRKKFNATENLNDKTSNKIYKINTILHIFAPLNGILIMVFHKCNRRKTPITKDRTDTMLKWTLTCETTCKVNNLKEISKYNSWLLKLNKFSYYFVSHMVKTNIHTNYIS